MHPDPQTPAVNRPGLLSKGSTALLDLVSSVRFGLVLLILIIAVSMIGMLVPQHNVPTFEAYYVRLTPFKQALFNVLDLFDVYGSWYFSSLIFLLALNIILSSADQLPKTWKLIRRPPVSPSASWIESQPSASVLITTEDRESVIRQLEFGLRKQGWRLITVTVEKDRTVLFAESGAWNRLGAYAVHVALLIILFGGLMSSRFSFSGQVPLAAGQTVDRISDTIIRDGQPVSSFRKLPFAITCTDLRQFLIDPNGKLVSENTLDWQTTIDINDGSGPRSATIRLNEPFDFDGYRFFHSNIVPIGKARTVTIEISSDRRSREVELGRDESVTLENGIVVRLVDFKSDLRVGTEAANENSVDYKNPAAILEASTSDGRRKTVFAFPRPDDTPTVDTSKLDTFEGDHFTLAGFEKVAERHILTVRYDPGTPIVYVGFAALVGSLLAVFLFSHQRVWCSVSGDGQATRISICGNTNRQHLSFETKMSVLRSSFKRQS